MAFIPIAETIPNYRDFKNNFLKAFIPGDTTTPKLMATDATGATTVSKFELDKDGFPKTSSGALVIPYIDGAYDLWLFPTAAEADANDTSNAKRFAIDISGSDALFAITKKPIEEITLTASQTTVTFTTINVTKADIRLTSLSGDGRTLLEGTDYTITSVSVIELTNSYPAGTICFADETSVETATFSESDLVKKFATLALAIADTKVKKDDALDIGERNAGTEGGATWDAVELSTVTVSTGAPAVGNIVASTGGQTPSLAFVLRVDGQLNVREFGARADGSDDKAAIESAISRGGAAKIYFPEGVYTVASQMSATDKFLHFAGDGPRVSEIRYTGTDGLFRLVRTGEETAFYMISDIMLNATSIAAGDAIQLEQDQTTGVIGGVDSLHIRNVILESTGTGYWTIGLHTINIGGVYISDTTFRNDNNSAAQNDITTRGIFIENNKAGINIIRALHMTNFYIQRFQRAVLCDAINTIESVYIDRGEFVGHAVGFYVSGAGTVGAINLSAIHMDSIEFSVFIESTANLMRIVGCDLRGASNGAAASNYIAVRLNEGETFAMVGTHISAHNNSSPSLISTGVAINSSIRTAISGCTFRNLDTGIILPTSNTEYSIGANDFQQVTLSVKDGFPNRAGLLEHLGLTTTLGTFGGDLDDLVNNIVQGMIFTRLDNAATNGPAAVNLTGAVITTMVFDANAAYQTLYDNTSTDLHYRKKQAGTWSAWVIK